MHKTDKERVVTELAERLKATDSLIVADYRGLTNAQLAAVRSSLRQHGATLTVVKNTLTRRAAEAAGTESLLALLEGPTAIAFVEADGDPVAVAKALADTAKETKILTLRGGILEGAAIGASDVEELAKLPPVDVLKSQLVGVIVAPLTALAGLLAAPLRDLVGLIDARIEQLGGADAEASAEPEAETGADEVEPDAAADAEAQTDVDEPEAVAEEDVAASEPEAAETPQDETDENEKTEEEQE